MALLWLTLASIYFAAVAVSSSTDVYNFYYWNKNKENTIVFDHKGAPEVTLLVVNASNTTAIALVNDSWSKFIAISYQHAQKQTGWDMINVTALTIPTDANTTLLTWYGAGYAEGYTTVKEIHNVRQGRNTTALCTDAGAKDWVEKHLAHIQHSALEKSSSSVFWFQIRKQLLQLYGLVDGHNNNTEGVPLTLLEAFEMNFREEYLTLCAAFNRYHKDTNDTRGAPWAHAGSALVAVSPEDLYLAHTTWTSYDAMINRQFKAYALEAEDQTIIIEDATGNKTHVQPAAVVSFTSSAGMLHSTDGWYRTSNGIAAVSTVNNFTNVKLGANLMNAPYCVAGFLRAMAANYLAHSGEEWTTLYGQENSGTQSSQWMVVDYKLFTASEKNSLSLKNGTLWVAEEIPGNISSIDATDILREQKYWSAYNIPFFHDIYEISGFSNLEKHAHGYYNYNDTARAKQFRKELTNVNVTFASVRRVLRYNNYENDSTSVVSWCPECHPTHSPMLAIAARGDLSVDYDNVSDPDSVAGLLKRPFGAIDVKVTSSALFSARASAIEFGPSHDTQPVFNWSTSFPDDTAATAPGMPTRFDYNMIYVYTPAPIRRKHEWHNVLSKRSALIVGIIAAATLAATVLTVGLYMVITREQSGTEDEFKRTLKRDVKVHSAMAAAGLGSTSAFSDAPLRSNDFHTSKINSSSQNMLIDNRDDDVA